MIFPIIKKTLHVLKYIGISATGITTIYSGGIWYENYVRVKIINEQRKQAFIDSTRIANKAQIALVRDFQVTAEVLLSLQDGQNMIIKKIDTLAAQQIKTQKVVFKNQLDQLRWYDQMFYNKNYKNNDTLFFCSNQNQQE